MGLELHMMTEFWVKIPLAKMIVYAFTITNDSLSYPSEDIIYLDRTEI